MMTQHCTPAFLKNMLKTIFFSAIYTALLFFACGASAASTREHSKQIIGYITNWDPWKATNAGFPVKGVANHLNVDMSQYTILNYAFFGVAYDGSLHSGDYRNKNIYQQGEIQNPAPLLNTDIYSSWDLYLLWGELEPTYNVNAAADAQGFIVNGQTWTHQPSGISGDFPIPVRKAGGELGIIERAHQQGVKVMASIGGWSMCKHFPEMAADPLKRAKFIDGVHALMGLGFDGIDLDWEYPGPFEGMNYSGSNADYDNFLTLVKDIRLAIGNDKLITAAFAADTEKLAGFNWRELSKYMDYFNMMTYDFNGGWSNIAGHNAPLYAYPGAEKPEFNWDHTAQWMLAQGISASKITMGFPFYGRGVVTTGQGELNAPTRKQTVNIQPDGQVSTAADYTHWPLDVYDGTPNYFYIQQHQSGWTERWDENAKVPYLTKEGYFLSYDNALSIEYKAQYVNDNNLAGGIVWTVMGDFECEGGYTMAGKLPVCAGVNPALANVINATFAGGCASCNGGSSSFASQSVSLSSASTRLSSSSASFNSASGESCEGLVVWVPGNVYVGGDLVQHNSVKYKARWWTQNELPSTNSINWGVWENLGNCANSHSDLSSRSSSSRSVSSSSTVNSVSSDSRCTAAVWSPSATYVKADRVEYNGLLYEAKWWTQNANPASHSGEWDVWKLAGSCGGHSSSLSSSSRSSLGSTVSSSAGTSSSLSGNTARRYVTYASTWNTSIYDLTPANIPNYVTNVNLAFVRPNTAYVRGSYAFDQAVAGFEFVEGVSGYNGQTTFTPQQASDLIANIAALNRRGTHVWLSVGGWSYSQGSQWQSFDASRVVDLAVDLGASGIDIDWESSGSQCNKSDASNFSCTGDAEIENIIATLYNEIQGRGVALGISIAGWSTGAYYVAGTAFEEGKVQWGSPFGGTMYNVVKHHGEKLSFINLMSYDGGSYYDPREGFSAYRAIYNGPINIGMEIAPEGSGGAVLTVNAPAGVDWNTGLLTGQNNDASAYYNIETMVNFVNNAGQSYDGFMLWQLWKQRVHQPAPAGAATENSAGQYVCRNLPLAGDCNQIIPTLPKR